jgi:hypothetical protein
MEPRLPSFPGPDARRIFYGESSAAEIFQRLALARKLAVESNLQATEKGKEYHDRKAKPHTYCVGQQVLLEEYYFLGKNTKLSPKWSGPHVILSLKGTHNVELLIQSKKKVIVNVDRIKPYQIPEVLTRPETEPESAKPESLTKTLPTSKAVYEFDGEKFVPLQSPSNLQPEEEVQSERVTEAPATVPTKEPDQKLITNRKRCRPRKTNPEPLPTSPKKNKWNMETQLPSTSRIITHSRAHEIPEEAISAINTSVPCFCGNQRLLKFHCNNCKQQMLN